MTLLTNCLSWAEVFSAIASIATAFMAIATFVTLRRNRKQMEYIQRPILNIRLLRRKTLSYIEIENVGMITAKNITITIKNYIPQEKRDCIATPFSLARNGKRLFLVGQINYEYPSRLKEPLIIDYKMDGIDWEHMELYLAEGIEEPTELEKFKGSCKE